MSEVKMSPGSPKFKKPFSLDHLPSLSRIWTRFGVTQAWLFGSHARGDAKTGSDWDFLVEFTHPPDFGSFMGLKFCLEEELGGPVDLLSRAACKPRFLGAIQPHLVDVT